MKIERGIPIPSVHNESKWSEVLSAMKIGDSVHPVMRQTTPRGTRIDRQMCRVWHNGKLTKEEKEKCDE
jgi:hypothetical protein